MLFALIMGCHNKTRIRRVSSEINYHNRLNIIFGIENPYHSFVNAVFGFTNRYHKFVNFDTEVKNDGVKKI